MINSAVRADCKFEKSKRMRPDDFQNVKERQSLKIRELSDVLVAAGFNSLDEQATALGLSRSTTWTILKAKHKNYGLSASIINRILRRPKVNKYVRAKIIEYVQEKSSGQYGHNKTQLRRFRERLSVSGDKPTVYLQLLTGLKAPAHEPDGDSQESLRAKPTTSIKRRSRN